MKVLNDRYNGLELSAGAAAAQVLSDHTEGQPSRDFKEDLKAVCDVPVV